MNFGTADGYQVASTRLAVRDRGRGTCLAGAGAVPRPRVSEVRLECEHLPVLYCTVLYCTVLHCTVLCPAPVRGQAGVWAAGCTLATVFSPLLGRAPP